MRAGRAPGASGLLATHGDGEHLLGRLAFPGLALGCAESTVERLTADPGRPGAELREFDEELMIDAPASARARLAAGVAGAGPAATSPTASWSCTPPAGTPQDGMALLVGWAGVLVVGDYLSPTEIPIVHGAGGSTLTPRRSSACDRWSSAASTSSPATARWWTASAQCRCWRRTSPTCSALRERGQEAQLPEGRGGGSSGCSTPRTSRTLPSPRRS